MTRMAEYRRALAAERVCRERFDRATGLAVVDSYDVASLVEAERMHALMLRNRAVRARLRPANKDRGRRCRCA